ncbi:MAG: hypothetical protein E7403_04375 [Ruminococcaceae bacterium]|nr:hypothetical protein [Oscillospiraceae bacterium]
MKTIIGIDGGGTKTEFVLCDETGFVKKKVLLGAGNPVDVGLEKACQLIKQGICGLLETKDSQRTVIDGMFIGLSGGSVSNNAEIIRSYFAKEFPLAYFENGSDAMNVISNGLEDDDGVILIAGTGSVAFARRGDEFWRVGGWGYLFDGAGGGYDLGQKAIQAALRELDGTGEKTLLSALLEKELGMSAGQALTKFYDGGKRFIASFAPLVFTAYKKKDAVAERIIDETVRHWVTIINRAGEYVSHTNRVALAGSLFRQKEILLPKLHKNFGREIEFILSDMPPVFGAIREGLKLAGVRISETIKENFLQTYSGR